MKDWCVYLLLCGDDTYYCGSTNDLDKRVELNGKPAVVRQTDAELLAAAGFSFAYLCDHKGAVVTVPAN